MLPQTKNYKAASEGCRHGLIDADESVPETVAAERAWTESEVRHLRHSPRNSVLLKDTGSPAKPPAGLAYAAAGLAHDLNNVLAPIITSIEVLRMQHGRKQPTEQLLSMLERHVRQAPFLVEQIMSFAHGVEHAHSYVQFASLLRGLKKQIRDTFPKNINVDFKIAEDLWPVLGSLADLHEALLNLSVNASEAMPQGGELRITAENAILDDDYHFIPSGTSAARYVVVMITDNGHGIPEEIREKIFEPAFSTKTGSAGQGLFRSNQIALTHHGHLLMKSTIGQGSTFKLYLPAAPGSAPGIADDNSVLPRGHGERILVVDDEEAIRTVTQQTFECFGYRVISAANGADAVSSYLQAGQGIALVFTDMNMPIMDGPATIHALRGINPLIKIIATSGLNATAQIANATHAGADYFLPKPYTAVSLLKLVQSMLGHEPLTQQ